MKRGYLLILILSTCLFTPAYGQQNIRTLQQQLTTAKGTKKADILSRLSSLLIQQDVTVAKEYAEEAYALSRELAYSKGITNSAYLLARIELQRNKSRKAAKYLEEGIAHAQKTGNVDAAMIGLRSLIAIYKQSNKKKKLAEAELEYEKLESNIQSAKIEELIDEYEDTEYALKRSEITKWQIASEKDSIESKLKLTVEEKLRQEAALAKLAKEKAELEFKTLQLEYDGIKQALEISEQENQILEYDAELKRQQFWKTLLILGIVTLSVIFFLLARNYHLEKVRAEEKGRLQKQLMMQEKLASLGQLTAGIAHEIKNPLNFVNNFAEGSSFLAEELSDTIADSKPGIKTEQYDLITELVDEFKQNAVDILYHGKRADRIINTMMEHTRDDKGERRMVDINRLLEDSFNLAYHAFKAQAPLFNPTITKALDSTLPRLKVAVQGLSRALINIFNNACYAINEKQASEASDYQAEILITSRTAGDYLQIYIRDNGIGMSNEIQQKIFVPFFTTKPTGQGNAGLGLSISYDVIVQEHNGKLEVKSEEGSFTAFTISLPLSAATEA
jgi:signal transduction histidine kinase